MRSFFITILTFIKKYKHLILLIGIFIFALLIRIYNLGILPFDFHEDEVLSTYIGRYILLNGKDIYGNPWPLLYFNKFGDYYIILPMYLAGISTFIFGINEFAARFPTAIIGALAIFPTYYLAKLTFNKKNVGLIAALFLAITPWHINLSRTMAEGIIGTTIFLTAICFLLSSVKNGKIGHLLISSIFFIFSYLIYHPYRIYTPVVLLAATIIVFFNSYQKRKTLLSCFFASVIFSILTLYILSTSWGRGRLLQTSIFNPISGVSLRMQEFIYQEGSNNIITARIFHNKIVGFGREFINQYLSYFSPLVLFTRGGKSPRFAIPDQGLFYLTFMFLIISLTIRVNSLSKTNNNNHFFLFLIFLLLLAPLPAAFTVIDSPNIHRTVFMIIPLVLLSAYGLYRITQIKFKLGRTISSFFIFLILLEFIYFWHQYSIHSDIYNSVFRNDGQKQLALWLIDHQKEYKTIYLPYHNTMALYFLFYKKDFNPKYINNFELDARLKNIDNVKFVTGGCPVNEEDPKLFKSNPQSLFVNLPNCKAVPEKEFPAKITLIQGINPLLSYKLYAN